MKTETKEKFDQQFLTLTGHPQPLSWQKRFYTELGKPEIEWSSVIDLPTGLGKTQVMTIWAMRRVLEGDCRFPTRLIYVVDRRTVVDQATTDATCLREKLGKNENGQYKLAVSTLRGQLADNREWSRHPTKPAIIIGTVDLIGSALLFCGYRSSYKRRPLEAGLLGQDALLILDEAHLSKPFEKLLNSIKQFNSSRGTDLLSVKPLKIIRMSATTSGDAANRFKLEESDRADPIIQERFMAKKTLSMTDTDDAANDIAAAADQLATDRPGSRIVIFMRTPKQVTDVRKALVKKDKSRETKIAVLTGTMRGLERDELVTPPDDEQQHERKVMQRFLAPDNDPTQGECFLIATSAGEVGFDLNADHMVCDATTIDSLIQRLGRVNRRGKGDAAVQLWVERPKKAKDGKPSKTEGLDLAIANTVSLLDGVTDVSPKNLAAMKESQWSKVESGQQKSRYELACSPEPTTVELTDILLDNWSMTSIMQPMPGRPEVGPWLRGIADDLPQTTIAWRAELDVPEFSNLPIDDIQEWFDFHRVLPHETLCERTDVAAKWFLDRWNNLGKEQQDGISQRSIIIDHAGLKPVTVKDLIDQLLRKNATASSIIRNADLIIPASFGGIERGKGFLDANAPEVPKDEDTKTTSPDVADCAKWVCRQREVRTKTDDGQEDKQVIGQGQNPSSFRSRTFEWRCDDERTIRLTSHIPTSEMPESGPQKQTLREHVDAVCQQMKTILNDLSSLPEKVKQAALLAAKYHDHGKNRDRWQKLVGGQATSKGQDWAAETLGKSGGSMKRDPRRYRHEFGSLRDLDDAFQAGELRDTTGQPIGQDVFDLAMHLIATHHGRGRPHFPQGGFDPDCQTRGSDEIHNESIRRFARLQRQYGWWHLAWLENLLRCADGLASAATETPTDDMKEPKHEQA